MLFLHVVLDAVVIFVVGHCAEKGWIEYTSKPCSDAEPFGFLLLPCWLRVSEACTEF